MPIKRVWSRPKHCHKFSGMVSTYGPSRTSLLDFKSYLLGGMRPSRPTILRNSSLMQRLAWTGIASKTRISTERLILIWCGETGRYNESWTPVGRCLCCCIGSGICLVTRSEPRCRPTHANFLETKFLKIKPFLISFGI